MDKFIPLTPAECNSLRDRLKNDSEPTLQACAELRDYQLNIIKRAFEKCEAQTR